MEHGNDDSNMVMRNAKMNESREKYMQAKNSKEPLYKKKWEAVWTLCLLFFLLKKSNASRDIL